VSVVKEETQAPGFRARLWTIASAILALVVILASGYYIARNISTGLGQVLAAGLRINYWLILLSLAITMTCTFLGAWEWKLLLAGLGYDLGTRKGLKIHLMANIAKYVPGYAWQLIGKAYLCEKATIPRKYTATSIALELFFIMSTGFLLVLLTLPGAHLVAMSPAAVLGLYGLALLGGGIIFLGLPLSARRWTLFLGAENLPRVRWELLSLAGLAIFLTWLLLGSGFCVLAAAVYPFQVSRVPSLLLALASSSLVSLLIIFVPTGLGVRESAVTFLLSVWMPPPIAALIAILARLVLVVGEAIGFVITLRL
jgi:uncharacterized membrane protein YbhN (UPF0104 family)